MTAWPIGLSTGCFYSTSIFDCLEPIRASGFSMIEVCSFPAHLLYGDVAMVRRAAHLIQELGLEAYSFHPPFAQHIDISSPDPEARRRALQHLLKAVDAAAVLKVHYLVVHPGPEQTDRLSQQERLQRMENTVGILNQVARHCGDVGVKCVLENKLPHLLFGNTSDILWILDALDDPEVGICLDIGHGRLAGDLHSLIQKFAGHLKMLHVHDNLGTADDHLPPGKGSLEWPKILWELSQTHFHGTMILELAQRSDPSATLAAAREGRSFLRSISREMEMCRSFSMPELSPAEGKMQKRAE